MDVEFLTPLGAAFAVTALVPLAVLVVRRRRLRGIRGALGLEEPTIASQLPLVLALVAVPALLGLAAAQPVVETTKVVSERADAQVFVVLDVSRSMLAGAKPGAPTRFERAQEIALALQERFPDVPFGIATVTDRVLPHLFPTTDQRVFEATVRRTLGIERPPPIAFYTSSATSLNSLRAVPERNFFPPSATKRMLVVLTDGETQPPEPELARAFEREPRVQTAFVRLWDADERIYETGVAEGGYAPDSGSAADLARVASLTGGGVFEEGDIEGVAEAVRASVGEGQRVGREQQSGRIALMPYVALAALLPLVVVLLRRNFLWAPRWPALRRGRAVAVRAEAAATAGVPGAGRAVSAGARNA